MSSHLARFYLSFHGLDALSLSLLEDAGTKANEKWKESKL